MRAKEYFFFRSHGQSLLIPLENCIFASEKVPLRSAKRTYTTAKRTYRIVKRTYRTAQQKLSLDIRTRFK